MLHKFSPTVAVLLAACGGSTVVDGAGGAGGTTTTGTTSTASSTSTSTGMGGSGFTPGGPTCTEQSASVVENGMNEEASILTADYAPGPLRFTIEYKLDTSDLPVFVHQLYMEAQDDPVPPDTVPAMAEVKYGNGAIFQDTGSFTMTVDAWTPEGMVGSAKGTVVDANGLPLDIEATFQACIAVTE